MASAAHASAGQGGTELLLGGVGPWPPGLNSVCTWTIPSKGKVRKKMKTSSPPAPHQRKDIKPILLHVIWWVTLVICTVYSVWFLVDPNQQWTTSFSRWVLGYLNFGSFLFAILAASIIFWRKSNDSKAVAISLMLLTWTATDDGFEFWNTVFSKLSLNPDISWGLAAFGSLIFDSGLIILLLYVLLTFPDEKWVPQWSRVFFWIVMIVQILALVCYVCLIGLYLKGVDVNQLWTWLYKAGAIVRYVLLIFGAGAQLYRLKITVDPLHRQLIKLTATALALMTLFFSLYWIPGEFLTYSESTNAVLFLPTLVFTYLFIATFLISVMRYRIWDIDITVKFVVNKTLVYSILITLLSVIGVALAKILDYGIQQLFPKDSSLIAVLISAVPVISLINPLKKRLQTWIDRRFNFDEMDFDETFVEFSPEMQAYLSSEEVRDILVTEISRQLDLKQAGVFILQEDGSLKRSDPTDRIAPSTIPNLTPQNISLLENGKVVVREDDEYPVLIPLIVERASKPDFLGVLALGSRKNGIGYSTVLQRNLGRVGADVGKIIYLAQLREQFNPTRPEPTTPS